jgi:SAM-dependent methyltransferase
MGTGTRYPHIEAQIKKHYSGGSALELGAGGAVYKDLFEEYTGTDLSSTPYQAPGDISVYCDARELPFSNQSFDFAFQVASLCLIPKAENVLSEVYRVLKPGGKFLIFDYSLKTTNRLATLHKKQGENVHVNHWTRRQMELLLRDAGFNHTWLMENKFYWRIMSSVIPGIADHARYWLMIGGSKHV